MSKQKDVKTKRIEIEYTDGRKIVVTPYQNGKRIDYGLTYYDKKGREEMYEGSWNTTSLIGWLSDVIEDDNADYDKEFEALLI